ncbi:MAG: DUF2203 domain-containing protein [Melioribacteraceae bacterium]|nr:DUF2203 domain-containing protein [Melioribacteraceae bacterium]MCF8393409.1 DUF2203 domain-containing protein [Melioribacteraceae bacterium]MCF8419266.1 DUF2203 domain-containing protein [Melioribacteraceae bacterium]
MNDTELKYFTVHEAQKTLPLVKQIVKDILDKSFEIRTIAESLGGDTENNEEVERLKTKLNGYLDELEEIGCFFKDWNFSIGLVDFPAKINDEYVYLCWRSDEEKIKHYHGIYEGFAGRKEIPPEYFEDEN